MQDTQARPVGEPPKVPMGPRWNMHDLYLKSRVGHDRLWVGIIGHGPNGEHVGTRLMPDAYIRRVMEFFGLDDIDQRLRDIHDTIADMEAWDADRWLTWTGSFAAVYSTVQVGSGRYTIEGQTQEDRVQALDHCFAFLRNEGASPT